MSRLFYLFGFLTAFRGGNLVHVAARGREVHHLVILNLFQDPWACAAITGELVPRGGMDAETSSA